jgi:hypothetical protein
MQDGTPAVSLVPNHGGPMRSLSVILCLFMVVFYQAFTLPAMADPSNLLRAKQTHDQSMMPNLSHLPLVFTENQGQWDQRVLFRVNAGGAVLWFTQDRVYYQFSKTFRKNQPAQDKPFPGQPDRFDNQPDSVQYLIIKASFLGANPNLEVIGEGQMDYKCNYFLGNDPTKWRTDVPNYSAIVLTDIYPGINLRFSDDGTGQVSYEFNVTLGADTTQIKVEYEGSEETLFDSDGSLIVRTKWGDMIGAMGPLYNGTGLVYPRLSFNANNNSDFDVYYKYPDQSNSPTITLLYSTYLGGADNDEGRDIAIDGSGNAFVTGETWSSNFPTQNPHQMYQDGGDVFVTKLSSSGNSLIYSTYLGGGYEDCGFGIAVDGSGNAYVTGWTYSSDFPTQNPYQTDQGSYDAFVTKLSSSGNSLIYSTYLGGGSIDGGHDIAVDESGNAYVIGYTRSSDFPTQNPYQTAQGGYDAFVTKLSSSGNSLIYSTYLGGGDFDWGGRIAVDGSGNAYVTGQTGSSDFPTQNPYQTYQGGYDAFVAKLSSSGDSLIYSTYLGGGDYEGGFSIAVDGSGNAYVTGGTGSSDFPTQNPYQTYQSGYDAFVTKLSSSGNSLIYSTYLGGAGYDGGSSIALDGSGNAYIAGNTHSSNFPTQNPYQMYQDSCDIFVTKLSSYGDSLIYSTYLGGEDNDWIGSIFVDGSDNAYVTGYTYSSNFPTQNPYQTNQGGSDVFVTKMAYLTFTYGDVNSDGVIDIGDVVYLINYLYQSGTAPDPLLVGDTNCDSGVDVGDVVYLINYLFKGGPLPNC